MLLYTNKDLTCFPKKLESKLCSHNISSLLGKSTVKMLFGMHYENPGQAPSVPIVPPGPILMFGYSIYFEDFVSSHLKLLTFKTHTHTKNLHATGIKI